ncbi:MAG: chemotaxis protein MotB [Gammaproteobacteria bacterium]|jgi:chemotaxis protein MotB
MDDEVPAGRGDDEAGGGWIMTFADLMSLLMCFFVLLLSFAEMDLNKFKTISGSLKLAFGVQREVNAVEIPMGTSIIAQEFSPAQPQPTAINEVRQSATDSNKQTLEFTDTLEGDTGSANADAISAMEALKVAETAADAQALIESLHDEIDRGIIQVETIGTKIIIRIREKGSFASGGTDFSQNFLPVTKKLREALGAIKGTIVVAGHTDNVPIKTARFRSNWELSASRAVTVVHELLSDGTLEPDRFLVEGHGDAHPLAPNDTGVNRSLNRRVEMIIEQDRPNDAAGEQPLAKIRADSESGDDITASVASEGSPDNPNELANGGSTVIQ